MTIHIENLEFECIVGLLDFERIATQKIIINCTILYDFKNGDFIDYAKVVNDIKNSMTDEKFVLLEDAILFLQDHLVKKYRNIKELYLKITKPSILEDCKVSLSSTLKLNS